MIILKQLFLLVISLTTVCCSKCDSFVIDGTHTWKKTDIKYYLNKEANGLTEEAVKKTFNKWDELTHFHFVYDGRHGAGLHRDGKNTVSFLLKWPDSISSTKIGYCMSWYDSTGHIIESDIIFNMRLTRFTTLATNTPGSYYIEGVLAHEIGHMIGLQHIESETCIMKSYSPISESFFKGNIDNETISAYKKLYHIEPYLKY